jgi:hypothetical protein
MKDDILAALGMALDVDHAQAVLDHRKTKKCALTVFAAKLLAKQFALCPDPNAAAEEMIIRGWQGFKAEWLARPQQRGARRNYVDAAMDRINGSESVFVDRRAIERISSEQQRPGPDIADLRSGVEGYPGSSRH